MVEHLLEDIEAGDDSPMLTAWWIPHGSTEGVSPVSPCTEHQDTAGRRFGTKRTTAPRGEYKRWLKTDTRWI